MQVDDVNRVGLISTYDVLKFLKCSIICTPICSLISTYDVLKYGVSVNNPEAFEV